MTLPLRLKITFNLIDFIQTCINSLNQNILSNIDQLRFGFYIHCTYICIHIIYSKGVNHLKQVTTTCTMYTIVCTCTVLVFTQAQ